MNADIDFFRLLQNINAWNEWRRKNASRRSSEPDEPDQEFTLHFNGANLHQARLSGADLHGIDFIGANLYQANLQNANLEGARFYQADLTGATLVGAAFSWAGFKAADLTSACLSDARLAGVDFSGAILRGTDLYGASLTQANLSGTHIVGANLDEANLAGAIMDGTTLADLDLSKVHGLEQVQHKGPSWIGIDTIYRSHGMIPHGFLRGAGVRENFIVYMASLVSKTIEYHSCFISYSNKDRNFADRLLADLKRQNVECWYAPHSLKAGDRFRESIDRGIREHEKLMVILSKSSVESNWVEKEIETAFDKERQQHKQVLFPIRIDDTVMETDRAWAADIRRTRHIIDFRDWHDGESYKRALENLLRDLQKDTVVKLATSSTKIV